MKLNTTWSPGDSHDTCSPTDLTTPAPSCPPMQGSRIGMSPVTRWSSEWHMPEACNSTSTSVAFGASSSIVSMDQGVLRSNRTAAWVCTGIPSGSTNDGLRFDEPGDALGAPLAADAGLLESAERAGEVEHGSRVDGYRTHEQLGRHCGRPFLVGRPHRTDQAVAGVVGDGHRLVGVVVGGVVVGDDDRDRTEDLLAGDLHVVGGSDERGGDEPPWAVWSLAADQHGGAVLPRAPQEPLGPVARGLVDQWTDIGGPVGGISDDQTGDRGGESGHKLVIPAARQQDTRQRCT